MTDTPPTADIGPATAAANVNLSPEAAALEIGHLRAGADSHFTAAYFDAGHMGHQAAVQRMERLHEMAYPDPAAPAGEPARDDNGRFAPADAAEAIDTTPYRALTLATMPEDTPNADLAKANEEIRTLAATVGVPADLSTSGLKMIERDIASRQGRQMDAAELGEFENLLQQRTGDDYDKACQSLQKAIERAGPRGRLLRDSIMGASPATAAWLVATMHYEGRR